MKRKVFTTVIIILILAGLIAVGIWKGIGLTSSKTQAVEVVKIEKGEISAYVTADGSAEEVEKAEVYFDTPMKVIELLTEEGQQVTKGQKLLEVDMTALESQLKTLQINRSTQTISLNSKSLDKEVERASNNLAAAERNYSDTKNTYEKDQELYQENAISKSELDMAKKAFVEAESGVSGLNNARVAYEAAVENKENSKQSVRDSLKVLDLQIADLNRKISTINNACLSPINGVITTLSAQAGAMTGSMQPVFTVIDPEKLQIRAKVKEFDIKNVAVGQQVSISGDAIDRSLELSGTIRSIAPVAKSNTTSTGTETVIEILISVDQTKGALKPGMNVTCEISAISRKDILLVPMDAITPDKDDNNMVYVVDPDTLTMHQQKIGIGINSDMDVEITSGLNEGDLVILDPQPSFKDGMRVTIAGK